jgi:hypothetical protein
MKGTIVAKSKGTGEDTPEVTAIGAVYSALKDLSPTIRARVLRYCAEMLGVGAEANSDARQQDTEQDKESRGGPSLAVATAASSDTSESDDADGINSVALRWMKRSGLSPKSLQKLFSLGVDEIDLVAKKVPGNSKKERMRSTLLLKGIAAYLGTGAARVTYEQLKEACIHYGAYDLTGC